MDLAVCGTAMTCTLHNQMRLLQPGRYRQTLDCPEARPLAPDNFRLVDRERQFGPAQKQGFQCASSLDARELMA